MTPITPHAAPKPAILVADDHAMFRAGLRVMLSDAFGDYEVVEAADLDQALEFASRIASLALFVIDLDMPGMNGVESVAAIGDGFPETRIAVMTGSESREDVLAALDAGALGFIPKALSADETRAAFTAILRGETYVPARLLRGGARGRDRAPAPDAAASASPVAPNLTPRQRDVGKLLATGLSTKEIARAMSLGEGTVKVHLAGLYRALGARNRHEAALKIRSIL